MVPECRKGGLVEELATGKATLDGLPQIRQSLFPAATTCLENSQE